MSCVVNVVSLLGLFMQAATILHPFGKYSLFTDQILKKKKRRKKTATSLKVIAISKKGAHMVLVLHQCYLPVTFQVSQRAEQ